MLGAAVVLLSAIACSGIATGITDSFTKVADAIAKPTAREKYARSFKENKEVYDAWAAAYDMAQADSTAVNLPYGEKGTFVPNANVAYTYTISVKEGEVLEASVAKDSASQVFIDIFGEGRTAPVMSNTEGQPTVTYEPREAGTYKIIIQPELLADSRFFISIATRPLYKFPVSGKGNAAIMSFWGMERDGGKRSHEGIDIFAAKGTPVVAVTDGYISYTGEKGLGGKQVWLRDGAFGKSLYYAHLDSIAVAAGTTVKTGDVLGYVGNTGNAKFTPPHLHFGIYTGYGAIDPLPFVFQTPKAMASQYPDGPKTTVLESKGKANMRIGPATSFAAIGTIAQMETLTLLGRHNDWLHVKTATGMQAFVHRTLVKTLK